MSFVARGIVPTGRRAGAVMDSLHIQALLRVLLLPSFAEPNRLRFA